MLFLLFSTFGKGSNVLCYMKSRKRHCMASDMRVDSPGHSGLFGSGSSLDVDRNKILDTQIIKVIITRANFYRVFIWRNYMKSTPMVMHIVSISKLSVTVSKMFSIETTLIPTQALKHKQCGDI